MLLSHSTPPHRLLRRSFSSPVSSSFNPNPPSNPTLLKMPTAPWMKSPVLLQPDHLLHHSNTKSPRDTRNESDCAFTGKIVGRRGDRDVKRIAQSLEKLQERADDSDQVGKTAVDDEYEFGVGGMFEKLKLKLSADLRVHEAKLPWDKSDQGQAFLRRTRKERVVTKAEMILDRVFLDRLRNEARRMREWVKVKKAGVTWEVVNEIRLVWRKQDLAMVKFDVPLCRNMDRACEIIEVYHPSFCPAKFADRWFANFLFSFFY